MILCDAQLHAHSELFSVVFREAVLCSFSPLLFFTERFYLHEWQNRDEKFLGSSQVGKHFLGRGLQKGDVKFPAKRQVAQSGVLSLAAIDDTSKKRLDAKDKVCVRFNAFFWASEDQMTFCMMLFHLQRCRSTLRLNFVKQIQPVIASNYNFVSFMRVLFYFAYDSSFP